MKNLSHTLISFAYVSNIQFLLTFFFGGGVFCCWLLFLFILLFFNDFYD